MMGIIIQARFNSSRLPGKVLKRIHGKPMLQYLIDGLSHCKYPDNIVIATSDRETDDPIEEFCQGLEVACYRGDLHDVARRFIGVIDRYGFDSFVRISGDSPLLDFRILDTAIVKFMSGRFDLVTNVLKRTFPKGQSVEIIDSLAFRRVHELMDSSFDREHVTTYFYTHQEDFLIYNLKSRIQCGTTQLSIDTPEDLKKIESLLLHLEKSHWEYDYMELVKYYLEYFTKNDINIT